jgi:nitroimidazol reductase NimA-like FMN-containing flavoprotein (pyridoxamine 5'-phosphate oxidase superfamily)
MKIISAIISSPSMSKEEVDTFLEKKLNLQIGTIDDKGDPNIHPVWFNYDKDREKFLIITPIATKKIKNLLNEHNVYFSVDDTNFPYKGVKGKGTATVVEDPVRTVPETKKIYMKYMWQAYYSQDTLAFSVLSGVRSMNEVFLLECAAEAYDLMMSGKAKFRCVLTTGN